MADTICIQLEVYLPFRGRRIWRGEEQVAAGTTTGHLPRVLGLGEPELTVLVGGRNRPPGTVLQDGDEVAILRQAEGGSGPS